MDRRTYYDRLSGTYDFVANGSEAASRHWGVNLLAVQSGEHVLEIGCGTGHALTTLSAQAGASGHVVGVDQSPGMLNVARATLAGGVEQHVTLAVSDARVLSLSSSRFDAVFMSFTLELFSPAEARQVLREVRRVLRSHGRLGVVALADTGRLNPIATTYKWLHRTFPEILDCQPIVLRPLLACERFSLTCEQHMSIWGLPVTCAVAVRDE
jgi:demethylmenaquinone methyltransferase/2-methoxy-6-polyprenyl-1,4-benzoquinol methylase